MKIAATTVLVAVALLCESVSASELFAAERHPALLGRVFLSPAERLSLDNRRLNPEQEAAIALAAETETETPGAAPQEAAAQAVSVGYIKSSSRPALQWQNGGFVPMQSGESLPSIEVDGLVSTPSKRQQREAGTDTADGQETVPDVEPEVAESADDPRAD